MSETVLVNPDRLARQAARVDAMAEEVRGLGRALTGVGRPALGGSDPAHELVVDVGTQVSTTATWVMTCASALSALAAAASLAAQAYRSTEQDAADRWSAVSACFDEFDDMYGLMTDPA